MLHPTYVTYPVTTIQNRAIVSSCAVMVFPSRATVSRGCDTNTSPRRGDVAVSPGNRLPPGATHPLLVREYS